MRRFAIALLVLSSVPLLAGGADPPPSPDADWIERFVTQHADEPQLLLQTWTSLDLRFRRQDRGFSGYQTVVEEYRIQDRAALEESSIVFVWDDPRQRLEEVLVEVRRGGATAVHRRDDLAWSESTQREDGVVTLDGTYSLAVIPGLQVGDRVRITRRWKLKGIHGLGSWTLGRRDGPTLQSTLELTLPADYEVGWGVQGYSEAVDILDHSRLDEKRRSVHRWNVQADAEGGLSTCRDDYPSVKITPYVTHAGKDHESDMAVGADWGSLGRAYLDRIEDVFEPSGDIRERVAVVIAGSAGVGESIDRIYAEVQGRCRYLGLFEGMGGILPVDAADVFEDGFGDCKGLGVLLISMLRTAGLRAHPVLVRTRAMGPLDVSAPNLTQFDHFIVWVDDGEDGIFLDATLDRCPAGQVPAQDTLSPVLLLDPERIEMVEIPAASWRPGEVKVAIQGRLDNLGILELQATRDYQGEMALWLRNHLARMSEREVRTFVERVALGEVVPMRTESVDVEGREAWHEPVVLNVSGQSRGSLPGGSENLLFPRVVSGELVDFDPWLRCGYDVDLRQYPALRETWRIDLPVDLSLAEADSLELQRDGVRWFRRLWQEGSTLRLERSVEFAPLRVSPEDAESIREVVNEARRRENGYFELRRQ